MSVAQEIHRVTVDEYVRIVRDLGWESTELLEGVVYDVASEYNRHAWTVMNVLDALRSAFPDDEVRNVGNVQLGPASLVAPDVQVIDGGFVQEPEWVVPASAVKLVVEVGVTTLGHDRGVKLIAYAKAAVPEVWSIDPRPETAELLRYRDPDGASYRRVDRFNVGENATSIDVAVLLGP